MLEPRREEMAVDIAVPMVRGYPIIGKSRLRPLLPERCEADYGAIIEGDKPLFIVVIPNGITEVFRNCPAGEIGSHDLVKIGVPVCQPSYANMPHLRRLSFMTLI